MARKKLPVDREWALRFIFEKGEPYIRECDTEEEARRLWREKQLPCQTILLISRRVLGQGQWELTK